MLLVGRVRALPEAEVRDDRDGLRVGAAAARRSSTAIIASVRERARSASCKLHRRATSLPRSATEYFQQNCWIGREPARPGRRRGPHDDRRRPVHVGQRLPARRGHRPVHHASTCARCSTTSPEAELREILAGNAAKLYDFDLDALAPLADQYGPTVDEIAEPLTELPENPNVALLRARRVEADRLIARCSTCTSSTSFRPVSNGTSPTPGRSSTKAWYRTAPRSAVPWSCRRAGTPRAASAGSAPARCRTRGTGGR